MSVTRASFVLLLLGLSLLLVGCSGNPNPEEAVNEFWRAFKAGDFEKAGLMIAPGSETDVGEMLDFGVSEGAEAFWSDEMTRAFIDRLDLKTTGHTIDGDLATVDLEVTWPDLGVFLARFLAEAFGVMLGAAFNNADEDDVEELIRPIFLEALAEAPDVTTEHQVTLRHVDGVWRLATSPLPKADEVFDLPDEA